MKASDKVRVGRTDVFVTRLGLGGTALSGEPPATRPDVATTLNESQNLIRKARELGVCYFDTAPMYGLGESERRLGHGLQGVPRDEFVLSTKVGRVLHPKGRSSNGWSFDFSANGITSSFTASLERLRVSSVEMAFLHDPDGDILFSDGSNDYFEQTMQEALPALEDLQSKGKVKAIGVGMNQWEMELKFATTRRFDCFLLAGRYTLLEQSALSEFLPYCEATGVSVIAGGPFNSGILAADSLEDGTFNYAGAPIAIIEKARAIQRICLDHGVPLKAAALQFVLSHPAIASVIPGARSAAELQDNAAMLEVRIPSDVWRELKMAGLLDPSAPTPAP